MKKKLCLVILLLLCTLFLYVISYFFLKNTKPTHLVNNDTVSTTYKMIYSPLRRLDAKKLLPIENISSSSRIVFNGCNHYGDKLFLEYCGEHFSLHTTSDEVSKMALSLTQGEEIYIYTERKLLTDDSFENSLILNITKIEKISQK